MISKISTGHHPIVIEYTFTFYTNLAWNIFMMLKFFIKTYFYNNMIIMLFYNYLYTDVEIPLAPLIFHRRCYRPSFILGGHAIQDLSAEKCFKQCKWKGVIGLKVSFT